MLPWLHFYHLLLFYPEREKLAVQYEYVVWWVGGDSTHRSWTMLLPAGVSCTTQWAAVSTWRGPISAAPHAQNTSSGMLGSARGGRSWSGLWQGLLQPQQCPGVTDR